MLAGQEGTMARSRAQALVAALATLLGSLTVTGSVAAGATPHVTPTFTGHGFHGTATVEYLNSTTTASMITVDTSGSGSSDATCGATDHTAATNVALGNLTEICAVVKDAAARTLADNAVEFTVSNGQIATHSGLSSTSTTSYTATTDSDGVAFADVTSTVGGAQTVTATADSASGSGTVTYAATTPTPTPTPIASAGAPASISLRRAGDVPYHVGDEVDIVGTVTDAAGRPVAGVRARYSVTGAQTASGTSSIESQPDDGILGFEFKATSAGTDSIYVYADTNDDGVQEAGEPSATITEAVGPQETPNPPPSPDCDRPCLVSLTVHSLHLTTANCVNIPWSVTLSDDGSAIDSVDVQVWNGNRNVDTMTFIPGTRRTTHDDWQYCPELFGVGDFRAGPTDIEYHDPDTFASGATRDSTRYHFTIKQAAAMHETIRANGSDEIITGYDRFFDVSADRFAKGADSRILLQRRKGQQWMTVDSAHTSSVTGLVSFSVRRSAASYRLHNPGSPRTWPATSAAHRA
jgi:hypothetical protein